MRIVAIRETTASMASAMGNAYINFRDMTCPGRLLRPA